MRVLVAETPQYIAFHGQAIFNINLCEGLVRIRHTVMALAASETGKAYHSERNGVEIEAIPAVSLKLFHPDAFLPLFSARAVRDAVDLFKPDIIHIQDHYPVCRNLAILAKRLKIPCVGTNHFMPENLAPYVPLISKVRPVFNGVLWWWMRETYNRLAAIACPSRTAAELLSRVGLRPPVYPISCGADIRFFHTDPTYNRAEWCARYGIDPKKKIFFFVGRVDREKRLDVLLHALQVLNRKDLELVIAGKGAYRDHFIEMSNHLGLKDRVHFTGFLTQEELRAMLNVIDIFAMPSEAELLSISTLQAMGCSRPVLAADAVALPELVTENVNGVLFKSGDEKDAARCMTWLADHPERWAGMGAASLEKVQAHSLEAIVIKYEELYKKVLGWD